MKLPHGQRYRGLQLTALLVVAEDHVRCCWPLVPAHLLMAEVTLQAAFVGASFHKAGSAGAKQGIVTVRV